MKTTREQLKSIVKECLIEILNEGIGGVHSQPAGRVIVKGIAEQRSNSRRRPAFDPRLDTPLPGNLQPSDELKETIRRNAGGNPLLAEIFTDTAMTTLPEMIAHGDTGSSMGQGGGSVSRDHAPTQQEQFTGTPDEVFGGSSNWADLAFP
jgi:hypothetical protein